MHVRIMLACMLQEICPGSCCRICQQLFSVLCTTAKLRPLHPCAAVRVTIVLCIIINIFLCCCVIVCCLLLLSVGQASQLCACLLCAVACSSVLSVCFTGGPGPLIVSLPSQFCRTPNILCLFY